MTFDFAAAIADIPDATKPYRRSVYRDGNLILTTERKELAYEQYAAEKHYCPQSIVLISIDGRVVLSCRPKGASHAVNA